MLGNQLNVLSLGEDTARSLGMRTSRMRGLIIFLVVLLAGGSVAVAGPIGFVGLAVPHIVRTVFAGRIVIRPSEVQVGIITAIVGAPFLIFLARQRRVADL